MISTRDVGLKMSNGKINNVLCFEMEEISQLWEGHSIA